MSETATDAPTPQQVLALPMQQPNDANAATIRDYLIKLLARLWEEGECFSGKRPLGNSSWKWDLFIPLVSAGFIAGKFETYDGKETGGLDECDDATGTALIDAAIKALGQSDEQPQDDGDVRAVALGAEIASTERITSLLHDLDARTKERDDARDLAWRCGRILRQMPTSLSELLDVDYEDLPGWFLSHRVPSGGEGR